MVTNMGKVFENVTWDDLCDLMCGAPEEDEEEEVIEREVDEERDHSGMD